MLGGGGFGMKSNIHMFFGGNCVKNVLDFDDIHIIFSMNKKKQWTVHGT